MERIPFDGKANWIWTEGGVTEPSNNPKSPFRVACFRRKFTVSDEGAALTVHVSADSRYILYFDGKQAARGPAKGDIRHQFYDTVELDALLSPGEHVLAAVVISYAASWPHPHYVGAPCSIMTASSVFVLDGILYEKGRETVLSTDQEWKALQNEAYQHFWTQGEDQTYTGLCERVDGEKYPWGWQEVDFDDSRWPNAFVAAAAVREDTVTDTLLPYRLLPRMIPMLEEEPQEFSKAWGHGYGVRLVQGEAVTIPPNENVTFVLDAERMTTAFLQLWARGGRGGEISFCYAEAYTVDGHKSPWHAPENGELLGCHDAYIFTGGEQYYEPLAWRAFRYVKVCIATKEEPLIIEKIAYRFIGYPLKDRVEFSCPEPEYNKIWEISRCTLRLCAHETFEDCPYYEQLQYAGDTQAEILYAGYLSGDWKLARQAVYLFDWSRGYDGLSASRYPSRVPQYIPSWSLLWVVMARDYYLHTADLRTIEDCLDGIRATLRWFERHENEDGLLSALPYWQVVDWVKEWKDPWGYPPGAKDGISAIINLQYACALGCCAWLCEQAGEDGTRYGKKAEAVCQKITELCWSEERGLYLDRPGGTEVSELGQAWAILSGAADERRLKIVGEHLAAGEEALARATLYGRFYVFRALRRAGKYASASAFLDWWREMARTDLTTWPEEPWLARSFCHAWSCAPLYEFPAEVLGVKPLAPGFRKVIIEPELWDLPWAKGKVPTPFGESSVSVSRGSKTAEIEVLVPEGIEAVVVWKGRKLGTPACGRWVRYEGEE